MTTAEEKEILSLLCKVHELEIDKVDMMMIAIVGLMLMLVMMRRMGVAMCKEDVIGPRLYLHMMSMTMMVGIVCLVRELEIDKMGWQIFKLSAEFRIQSIGPSGQKYLQEKGHVFIIEKFLQIGFLI